MICPVCKVELKKGDLVSKTIRSSCASGLFDGVRGMQNPTLRSLTAPDMVHTLCVDAVFSVFQEDQE